MNPPRRASFVVSVSDALGAARAAIAPGGWRPVPRVMPRRSSIETIKALVDVIKERSVKPVLWIDEA